MLVVAEIKYQFERLTPTDKSPDQEVETEVKESVLEGKILNQLIHQIPSDKIPQTNFRVKKKSWF